MQGMARSGKSVLSELLPDGDGGRAYQHFPHGNAHDPLTGFRCFYHCHPQNRASVIGEHGHFHLFADLKTSLVTTHLMGLSVNAQGIPSGLFLPNLWVTEDQSQDWHSVWERTSQFEFRSPSLPTFTRRWLEHAVHAFKLALPALWQHKLKRLEALGHEPGRIVAQNRRVEVLSRCRIDLPAWAAALEA